MAKDGRSSAIQRELQQRLPLASTRQEAFLSLLRTAAVIRRPVMRVLEERGLSMAQYNVLRILRGAGPGGLCRNEIRDRLLTRMPDVTRLLDRMAKAGLVIRGRSTEDRRLVSTRLTGRGSDLVARLDGPVAAEHQRRLGHLTTSQLRTLIELLALARQKA